MALLLGLSRGVRSGDGWRLEGSVVDGVEAGRRLRHLALQLPQGPQAVDLGLVLHPLLPSQQEW